MAMATELHQRLVDQLATKRLLDNPRLRAAFQAVRREHFLPGVAVERVYQDDAVTCHSGPDGTPLSSASQPTIVAVMLNQLDPQPGDHVLEIGAGSGYNAALLAHLVAPGGQVPASRSTRTSPRLPAPTWPARAWKEWRCGPVTAGSAPQIRPPSTASRRPSA
jgi:protein-L-isoaspartate O-methyltransferase